VRLQRTIPNGPLAPTKARSILRELPEGLSDESRQRVGLALSEIVTNSFKHAGNPEGAPIEVSVEVGADRLRVEVRDHSILDPTPESWREAEDVRWELLVLDRLATGWGKTSEGHVWAEFKV
jgi:anti-sigma regulatory factor (Ser/Thr protein kinase)